MRKLLQKWFHSIIAPLSLILLTLVFVWPLFKSGYGANVGSTLEPATLILARRVAEHGIWGWYENWYLGFPFRFAGPPLSWWLLGGIEKTGIFNLLTVYRVVQVLALVTFPISFYFLAKRVFGEQKSWAAFFSSIFLILLPSIGYLFPKFFQIGANFGFAPAWMQQELSRSLGLALLPLVLLLYWRLLEEISYWRLLAAVLSAPVLFLTDGVTSLSLLVGLAVILIFEGTRRQRDKVAEGIEERLALHGDFAQRVAVVALALILAFLIDAFYFTPLNLRVIAASPSISGMGLASFVRVMIQAAIGLGPAILVVTSFKLLKKGRVPLGFSLLWLLPFLTITLLFYLSNREFMTEYTRFCPRLRWE